MKATKKKRGKGNAQEGTIQTASMTTGRETTKIEREEGAGGRRGAKQKC